MRFRLRWILVIDSWITLMIPAFLLVTDGWPPFTSEFGG